MLEQGAMASFIPGYRVTDELYRSRRTVIYRAIRETDLTSVIIKTLSGEYASNRALARLRHEFHILRHIDSEGVLRADEHVAYQKNLALILKDFQGQSLHDRLKQQTRINLKLSVRLAIQITRSLGDVHHQHVIHKNINPKNILVNQESDQIQIIDFGEASNLSSEKADVNATSKLQGSLAYVSPEQTGRMNREVDYRTDYYSLGVTLYEMLAGVTPFDASDTMGWVHCHLAQAPTSLHELDPSIPEALSNVVSMLLSKNAEGRYQSSIGIVRDLEECHTQLMQYDRIDHFELARCDSSEKFQIPQTLLGRENELDALLSAFDSVAGGGCEYLLVSGYSGVGKSALVHETHKPIVRQKGYFIDGKFDQFQRDIPYIAFVQAFRGLTTQLLSETAESLALWKARLLEVLHPNGQIIIDLIPDIENIIGKQPGVQELGSTEAENRFFLTFKSFIRVFVQESHPLVLFLDDLQWSDVSTLKLIEYLISSRDMHHFFLIGAFRSNEVHEGHPLQSSLEELEKTQTIRRVLLRPLEESHVNHLVAETLHCDVKTALPLSALLFSRTRGNPFFVGELLKNLYREGVLQYLPEEGCWDCDLTRIREMDVTDNVVELMIHRLKQLPEEVQRVLETSACIGSVFDLRTLSVIRSDALTTTAEVLLPAIREGIIIPLDAQYRLVHLQDQDEEESDFGVSYRFQHDRVQQAAYSLLEGTKRSELHLRIARLLQQRTPAEHFDERLIEIVRHFNEGKELVVDPEERDQLCSLNLRASKKAKRSMAHGPAFEYAKIAHGLLPPNAWAECYRKCFDVHDELAESASLNGDLDLAEEICQLLLREAKSRLEKVQVYRLQAAQCAIAGRREDAIETGIRALSLLGIKVSSNPSKLTVLREILAARWNLGGRDIASLVDQHLQEDPERTIAMQILIEMIAPAYLLGRENLFAVVALKQVNLALRFGNCPEAAYAYVVYAMLLNGISGDLERSHEFGDLALALNEKLNDLKYRCRIVFLYANFVHAWNNHIGTTHTHYRKAMEIGLQTGDLLYSGYASAMAMKQGQAGGLTLHEAMEQAQPHLTVIADSSHPDAMDLGNTFQQYRLNLLGKTLNPNTLSDSCFDEEAFLSSMLKRNYATGLGVYYAVKLQIYYLHGSFMEAVELMAGTDRFYESVKGQSSEIDYCFYATMNLAGAYSRMSPTRQRHAVRRMAKECRTMRKWCRHEPVNFRHLILMMEAEMARVTGDPQSAISLLEKALESATANEFPQYKAIANELLGITYLGLDRKRIAGLHLSDAYHDYQSWGAIRKVELLHKQHGRLIQPGTSFTADSTIDMITVAEVAQAISSEVVVGKLMVTLMETVRVNAGAEKAIMLLADGEGHELVVRAKSVGQGDVELMSGKSSEESADISRGIVNYVARTLQHVVIGDATHEGMFTNDPDIQKHRSKSVLCMPILNQGKLLGVLYLENNVASHAFTSDRLEVLRVLAAQSVIVIENALVFEELTKAQEQILVRQRRETELAEAKLADLSQQLVHQTRLATIGQMTASIAHEIRNPLGAVRNAAYLMKRKLPAETAHLLQYLKIIDQEVNTANVVIRDMLEMARSKEPVRASIDLSLLVREVFDHVANGSRRLELVSNPDPFLLDADFGQLRQVINNLVTNAVQATGDNGVVTVELQRKGRQSLITVRDNGCGIAAKDRDRLFEPLFTTKAKGTGLGLSICRQIIERHGGTIELRDHEGSGAQFCVRLPHSSV
ncbi:MAG: AAA family ATPase [Fuerstiella sp.]|nr:GAF domain-containing protein [Fuerstiella sp.]